MISSLSRYRKKLTTKCRGIHFIKAETGQQSPRQCPDGNRHSDDGKPKDIGQRYRGKHGSGRTCYKVRGWSTGFSWFFKVKNQNTVYIAGKEVDGMKRPREPPTGGIKMDIGRILPTEAAAILNVCLITIWNYTTLKHTSYSEGATLSLITIWNYTTLKPKNS